MAEATRQGQIAPQVKLVKRIVPFEDSSPAEEPLFINYAQVAHAGGCAYIDVGVIPLDDILAKGAEATFLVLNRLVMSKETLAGLRDQITALLSNEDKDTPIALDTPATRP
jgi:hypothetical protein